MIAKILEYQVSWTATDHGSSCKAPADRSVFWPGRLVVYNPDLHDSVLVSPILQATSTDSS